MTLKSHDKQQAGKAFSNTHGAHKQVRNVERTVCLVRGLVEPPSSFGTIVRDSTDGDSAFQSAFSACRLSNQLSCVLTHGTRKAAKRPVMAISIDFGRDLGRKYTSVLDD